MIIRRFTSPDADQIAQLYHDTIRQVNSRDYSEEQVKAWAPDDIHFRDWQANCENKFTLVAEAKGLITGFAQLEEDGYIDCFFCHKDYQGRGIGTALYHAIETIAREKKCNRLHLEASITAKPFFLKMGFRLIKAQKVEIRGQLLKNFKMEKELELHKPSIIRPSILN